MRLFNTAKQVTNELFDAFQYFIDGDDFTSSFNYQGKKYLLQTTEGDLVLSQQFGGPSWSLLLDLDTGRPVINSMSYGNMDLNKVLNNIDKFTNLLANE